MSSWGEHWRSLVRLRPRETSTLGLLSAVAWVALTVYLWSAGWFTGRTVDYQQAVRAPLTFQVDLNTADWPELSQLPGVGETLARRMVEYHAAHGAYRSSDELLKVQGVGAKTLERIRPHLIVEPPRP